MSFEKKKIQLDTLGEYLSEIRQSLNLEIKAVAEKTGISKNFIESLESGNFCKLPADVYVIGFLRQLSSEYHIDSRQLIDQYKKERSIYSHLQKQERTLPKGSFKKLVSKIAITPKIVSLVTGLFFVGITIFYIIWQVASLSRSPSLEVIEPLPGQVYRTSFVGIKGKTDIGSLVTVNDQPVFVDEYGIFQTQIGVNSGPKDVVIISKNKFEKVTKKTIGINVDIKKGSAENGLELMLNFTSEVTLKVSLDDGKNTEQVFQKGDAKTFVAKTKMVISTSDAGATEAVLNGEKIGPLGRSGESLRDVPFFADTSNLEIQ